MPALLHKSIIGPLVATRAWSKRIFARRQTRELRALRRRVEAARLGVISPG
jgi:hypothetical protein